MAERLCHENDSYSSENNLKSSHPMKPKFDGNRNKDDETAALKAYSAAYNALFRSFYAITNNTDSYETWFGVRYEEYQETVTNTYSKLINAMKNEIFTVYFHGKGCSDKNEFAYVCYGYNILYMCDLYFTAQTAPSSSQRYNSKMGIFIHELSHLKASTLDYEYGVDCCKKLASRPSWAVINADNYEYFSESN